MNNDQISSLICLLCGLFILLGSFQYDLGTLAAPKEGLLPFLISLVMCFLSIVGFLHGTLGQRKGLGWKPMMTGLLWKKPLIGLLALIGYVILLDPLGFTLCTTLFIGFLLRAVYPQRWRVVILGAIGTAVASYVVFTVLLKTQLPKGPWGF